uniref:Uncharacterized protein n=1 Tax=Timema monikensis TaxID=170555 RepID=A0A7R9EDH8_9NEOP|nr:unnamed protein product [Timema monikensis]
MSSRSPISGRRFLLDTVLVGRVGRGGKKVGGKVPATCVATFFVDRALRLLSSGPRRLSLCLTLVSLSVQCSRQSNAVLFSTLILVLQMVSHPSNCVRCVWSHLSNSCPHHDSTTRAVLSEYSRDWTPCLTLFAALPSGELRAPCSLRLRERNALRRIKFALAQIKLALVTIILHYKVSVNKKTTLPLTMDKRSLLTYPTGGLWLNFNRRNQHDPHRHAILMYPEHIPHALEARKQQERERGGVGAAILLEHI